MIKDIILEAVQNYGIILILMLADLVTGLAKALKKHSIKSARLRNSLHKAIIYFIVLIIGGCLNYAGEPAIQTVFVLFLCLVESISILENVGELMPNLKFVEKLTKFLETKSENKLK